MMRTKGVYLLVLTIISVQGLFILPNQVNGTSNYYGTWLHSQLIESNGIIRKFIVNNYTASTLFDDLGTTFWTLTHAGSGSFDYTPSLDASIFKSGLNSYLVTRTAGPHISASALHTFSPNIDYSTYSNLEFWYYGSNDSSSMKINLWCPDYANRYTFMFTDDFIGWKFFNATYPGSMTPTGSPNKSTVGAIEFFSIRSTIRMDQLITRNYPASQYEVWEGATRLYSGIAEPDINDFIPYNTDWELASYIGFGLFALFSLLGFITKESDASICHGI